MAEAAAVKCPRCGFDEGHDFGCALSVSCPDCRAPVDVPCASDGRLLAEPHRARQQSAGPAEAVDTWLYVSRLAAVVVPFLPAVAFSVGYLIWLVTEPRAADRPYYLAASLAIPVLFVLAAMRARATRITTLPRFEDLFRTRRGRRVGYTFEVAVTWMVRILVAYILAFGVVGEVAAVRTYAQCGNESPCPGQFGYNYSLAGLGLLLALLLGTVLTRLFAADRVRST